MDRKFALAFAGMISIVVLDHYVQLWHIRKVLQNTITTVENHLNDHVQQDVDQEFAEIVDNLDD